MSDLNPRQFRQQRLFAPLGMTKKPHQQTPLEFANSPRTMWHGSFSEDFEEIRNSSDQFGDEEGGTGQGFHIGTLNAAHERMERGHRANEQHGYLHPVRVSRRDFLNTPDPDDLAEDMGDDWQVTPKPQWYRNEFEDEGSVSAVMSDPHQVTHHADYVHDALAEGGIPSGAAEYHATHLDSEHSHHSPGFPRAQFEAYSEDPGIPTVGGTVHLTPNHRRLRAREDTNLSPVTRAHRDLNLGQPRQQEMFKNTDAYDGLGGPRSQTLVPDMDLVPEEKRAAVHKDNERRTNRRNVKSW